MQSRKPCHFDNKQSIKNQTNKGISKWCLPLVVLYTVVALDFNHTPRCGDSEYSALKTYNCNAPVAKKMFVSKAKFQPELVRMAVMRKFTKQGDAPKNER